MKKIYKWSDILAYTLILILTSWIVFCWYNIMNPYYHYGGIFEKETWGTMLYYPMIFTRIVSGAIVIFGSFIYIIAWLSKKYKITIKL